MNVSADVNSTVHLLPRLLSESQTIPVKLKRCLSYKHHYKFESVRPRKVLEGLQYLAQTSKLFQDEGIQIDTDWIDTLNSQEDKDFLEFHALDTNEVEAKADDNTDKFTNQEKPSGSDDNVLISDKDDEWCEVEERPAGVMDTLLQEPDIAQNIDSIISFAPAEGNRLLGIFVDKESEFLSFPTIYCGKRRPDNSDRQVLSTIVPYANGN